MGKFSPSARYRFIYSVLTIICLALRTGNTLCHWHKVFVWNLLPKMVRVWLLTILSLILLFFILLFFLCLEYRAPCSQDLCPPAVATKHCGSVATKNRLSDLVRLIVPLVSRLVTQMGHPVLSPTKHPQSFSRLLQCQGAGYLLTYMDGGYSYKGVNGDW